MGKRIIICLDGTGNEVKAHSVTNVFKISEVVKLAELTPEQVQAGEIQQVLYYGPGVGTLPSPNARTKLERWMSKVVGGSGLGHGMRTDVGEAYTYLMNTWRPGDDVFVFGFSRGAYTARALCGMLFRVGLMRPGSENLIPYALQVYAREPGPDSDLAAPGGWDLIDRFAGALSRKINGDSLAFPIRFLGLFDTVKGTGIVGPDITWPYTNQLPNVEHVVHAVSIDENRKPFRECLINQTPQTPGQSRDEVWFAGIHSDVGGSFDAHPGLGKISMRWMLDKAIAAGLQVRPVRYANLYTLSESDATEPKNANTGVLWQVAGHKDRTIPAGARMHASVATRRDHAATKYHPRLPEDVQWEGEQNWWKLPAPGGQ